MNPFLTVILTGNPQTRKTSIGKIDPKTGEPIYKTEYLKRVRETDKEPFVEQIKNLK